MHRLWLHRRPYCSLLYSALTGAVPLPTLPTVGLMNRNKSKPSVEILNSFRLIQIVNKSSANTPSAIREHVLAAADRVAIHEVSAAPRIPPSSDNPTASRGYIRPSKSKDTCKSIWRRRQRRWWHTMSMRRRGNTPTTSLFTDKLSVKINGICPSRA